VDILTRVARLVDEVVVAVLVNPAKSGLFTPDERVEMLREVSAPLGNVSVESFSGLLVDFCRARKIPVVVKGLRAVTDFEYELQMAQMNHRLAGVDTMFVATDPEYSFLSSSLVKEVATYGGDVAGLVPTAVHERLTARLAER
jgi:pantetheine-phosphate adenylyltransferase